MDLEISKAWKREHLISFPPLPSPLFEIWNSSTHTTRHLESSNAARPTRPVLPPPPPPICPSLLSSSSALKILVFAS